MRISKINNDQNFGARVDKNFIRSAEDFYLKRALVLQYDSFQKHLEKFEYFGSEKTEIIPFARKDNGRQTHFLCLKNKEINPKQALILAKFDKFSDMLKFFTKITDSSISEYEKLLANTK